MTFATQLYTSTLLCGQGEISNGIYIGLGVNGRGPVELVVATVVLDLSEPLLTQDQFSALILMAFVTTLIAPVSLKWGVQKTCLPVEKEGFCRLWDDSVSVTDIKTL